jgi:hypothetical protein
LRRRDTVRPTQAPRVASDGRVIGKTARMCSASISQKAVAWRSYKGARWAVDCHTIRRLALAARTLGATPAETLRLCRRVCRLGPQDLVEANRTVDAKSVDKQE